MWKLRNEDVTQYLPMREIWGRKFIPKTTKCLRCGHRLDDHSSHSVSQPCLNNMCTGGKGVSSSMCKQFVVVKSKEGQELIKQRMDYASMH